MSSFSPWLEAKIEQLAEEISDHPVFDSEVPATSAELQHLKTLCVIHRFLSQELERRRRGMITGVLPLEVAVTCAA